MRTTEENNYLTFKRKTGFATLQFMRMRGGGVDVEIDDGLDACLSFDISAEDKTKLIEWLQGDWHG